MFSRSFAAGVALAATILGTTYPVSAGDKDLVLRRLADRTEVTDECCLGQYDAVPDIPAFRALSKDLGLVFAPRFLAPAETLGQAGFDVGAEFSFTSVNTGADHWRALESQDPGAGFATGQLHVRKGLPFSFEIGGTLMHLFESEMYAVGTELKFALNEGFFYLPDLAVRGTFNTVVGSSDLNLLTTGFDVSISKSFGVVGVVNITPYAGYNHLVIFSSSRLLDVSPEDPTPPTINEDGDLEFQPEFVFDTQQQQVNRFFGGTRFLFGVLALTLEADISETAQTYSARVSFDF
jgi:hypothetical protein